MSTQNVNVARFARNVEWDFFCDFQTLWPIIFFKNVRHPWANLKIFNPSKHFQKEFYAFAIILNALYGALKKSQWQKGVEYITILFSESHFIFRDISIFLWEAALLVSWTRRSRKGSIFALLKQKLFFTRVTIIRSTAAQSLVIVQFGMSKP